jgi:HEAT repeat protein
VTEIDAALQQLASPDPAVRADAIRRIAADDDPSHAGPAIAALLTDGDELVRAEAADAVGQLGYQAAVDVVRGLLRSDGSALVRAAAAETLGDLGQPAALAELVGALDDEDSAVRGYAANAIGLLGTASMLPVLDLRLGVEPVPSVRVELIGGRYRLGAPDALAELIAVLDAMDLDLGYNVLNVWDDLTSRRQPAALAQDAPDIAAALDRVAVRLPELRGHAELVMNRLRPQAGAP